MSKHIPLPLERRGTMVYSQNACNSCATFICQCRTAEQADEIIVALSMHATMEAALRNVEEAWTGNGSMAAAVDTALLALTPPKKETAP